MVRKELIDKALEACKKYNIKECYPLTIIDYSLPSTKPRLWVLNDKQEVIFNTYVAHGSGSGGVIPDVFSNVDGSHCTCLGLFKTGETYTSQKVGFARRLDGLEKGKNDNTRSRGIVIHGSKYVSKQRGVMNTPQGRSWGCPAVPMQDYKALIELVGRNHPVYSYSDLYPS